MLHKTISFCSLAGVCLCVAGLLLDSVGADCNNLAAKGTFCLAESEWTSCNSNNREICNVSESMQSGGFVDKETIEQANSHAEPVSQNVKCYTTRTCSWHIGDQYDEAGCYGKGAWIDVPQSVTIYIGDTCGE